MTIVITKTQIIVAAIIFFFLTIIFSIGIYKYFNPTVKADTSVYEEKIKELNNTIQKDEAEKKSWQSVQDSISKVISVYQVQDDRARQRDAVTLEKMKKNELLLKDIQKKYEKVNRVDSFSDDQLLQYISNY